MVFLWLSCDFTGFQTKKHEEAIDADALADAVSVLGPEDGMALIESLENTEVFLVAGTKENPQIYRSSGIGKYEVISRENKR